jgi:glyoxylase-like metal-dependent hydrolase (beta-lactamase superfamily II)
MKAMASFIRQGMLHTPAIGEVQTYSDGKTLEVPGKPRVIFTPGHTIGHASLLLRDLNVLLAGDALVIYDPYTGRHGPRVVARAATADSREAKQSLNRLASTKAQLVLTGHGEPWTSGVESAVEQARTNPVG